MIQKINDKCCPTCYTSVYGLTPRQGERPLRPGDYVICDTCGSICQLGESMELLTLDADALGEMYARNPSFHEKISTTLDLIKNKIKQN